MESPATPSSSRCRYPPAQTTSVIVDSSDSYYQAVKDLDQSLAELTDFTVRQDAARKDCDAKMAQCAAVPALSPSVSGDTFAHICAPTVSHDVSVRDLER